MIHSSNMLVGGGVQHLYRSADCGFESHPPGAPKLRSSRQNSTSCSFLCNLYSLVALFSLALSFPKANVKMPAMEAKPNPNPPITTHRYVSKLTLSAIEATTQAAMLAATAASGTP